MDVEGTDGRERGEDQEFERRSALFSIATSEIIIVNIWENMVGLYNGANMGLLKTVFEVNLQLFHHTDAPKTCLFFVIRDHIGTTSLDNLRAVLLESLNKIWSEVGKVDGHDSAQISDFFDFQFAALPHKILQPEKFEVQVDKLRMRFTDKSDSEYVFNQKYHKNIPADGFHHYMQSIWMRIIENKDLDIPTQQQLLAQYRCDEIAAEISRKFSESISPYVLNVDSSRVCDDFNKLGEIRSASLTNFGHEASRYHVDVYERKKQELLVKLNSLLNVLFVGQLRNLRKKAMDDFKYAAQQVIKDDSDKFAEFLVKAQSEAMQYFESSAKMSVLSDTDWSFDEEHRLFREDLEELSAKIRVDEMEKLVKRLLKSSQNQMNEQVMEELANCNKDMWPRILDTFVVLYAKLKHSFSAKISGFNSSEDEIDVHLHSLSEQLWSSVRTKLHEETSDHVMQMRLKQCFEDRFRYDDDGLPRVWQRGQNIESFYLTAKEATEDLVSLFAKVPVPAGAEYDLVRFDDDYDEDAQAIILLPSSKQRDLKDRLRRDADSIFTEVKRGAVASLSEIPKSIWILLLLFGFNEIYAALSFLLFNPALLILLLIIGVVVGVLYQSGMLIPASKAAMSFVVPSLQVATSAMGPFIHTMSAMAAESVKQLSERMNNNDNVDAPEMLAMSEKKPELADKFSTPVKRSHTPSTYSTPMARNIPTSPKSKNM